ncbi:MAG: putative electron transport protein YccM [Candidatus Heimdallarchaeota archaeon AB_125]|nr:MAG: putative electron transport protein YccM [Candidatus Heimdallarchaeota archaeon AB_125]
MATVTEKSVKVKETKKHPKRQGFRRTIIYITSILFPVVFYYLSPMVPIQGGKNGVIAGSLFVFAGLFVFSLFLGRAYCGWVCPAAGFQEVVMNIKKNNKRVKAKSFFVKWIIWIPWLTFVIINPFVLGTGIHSANFFYLTEDKLYVSLSAYTITGEVDQSYFVYFLVVAIIVLLAIVVGKRSFCHHVCWMAPFMIVGRWISNLLRIPSLRLKPNTEACIECHRCTRECPMSLEVEEMVKKGKIEHRECILCGTCADVCPKGVITYSFSSYKK